MWLRLYSTVLMCLYTTKLQAIRLGISLPTSKFIVFNRNDDRLGFLDLESVESQSMTYRSGSFSYPLRSVTVAITIRLGSHVGRGVPVGRTLSLDSGGGNVLLGGSLTSEHCESTRVDRRGSSSWSRGLRRGGRGSTPVVDVLGRRSGSGSSPAIFLSFGRGGFISSPAGVGSGSRNDFLRRCPVV
jgi:hypothetical protein